MLSAPCHSHELATMSQPKRLAQRVRPARSSWKVSRLYRLGAAVVVCMLERSLLPAPAPVTGTGGGGSCARRCNFCGTTFSRRRSTVLWQDDRQAMPWNVRWQEWQADEHVTNIIEVQHIQTARRFRWPESCSQLNRDDRHLISTCEVLPAPHWLRHFARSLD